MNEFLQMGGYAFYVWTSIAVFFGAMLLDFISLKLKANTVRKEIRSFLRRKSK